VKLLDFGSACLLNAIKGMKGNVGTTMYMAPEALTQEILYHKSSDMWSVGVVAYCLLTS
jgi:serine/threonine protein kinase